MRGIIAATVVFWPVLAAAIEPLPTSVVGFVGMATRGPVDAPVLIRSWEEHLEVFGDFDEGLAIPWLSPSVRAFFANGGRRCHVVRVASPDDADLIGALSPETRERTGLQALAEIDEIGVLCIPGVSSPAVQQAVIAQCESLGDRFGILDPRADAESETVQDQRRLLDSSQGFAALYFPWVEVDPGNFGTAVLPPSGFVAGVYARVDGDGGVWSAPVGAVHVAEGVTRDVSDPDQDLLNQSGICVIRDFPDLGIRVWGARTISSDNEWKYVNVRRYVLFLEESIQKGTEWAVFEENDATLWARLEVEIGEFLEGHWREGALQGAKAEDAYFVRVDSTTTTPAEIEAGRTVMLLGVAPLKPAEFLQLTIVQERFPPAIGFRRGDTNADSTVDISDAVATLGALFLGDGEIPCLDAADANDDGTVDLSDAVFTLGVLFLGQGTIPYPGVNACGVDPTDDPTGCESYDLCP